MEEKTYWFIHYTFRTHNEYDTEGSGFMSFNVTGSMFSSEALIEFIKERNKDIKSVVITNYIEMTEEQFKLFNS